MKTEHLVLAAVAIAGGIYFYQKSKEDSQEPVVDPTAGTTPVPTVMPLNRDLVLKVGSRGQEVMALQVALGFVGSGIDGAFGNLTLAALQKRKNVSQVSLNQFNKLPNANTGGAPSSLFKVGDDVESNVAFATAYKNEVRNGVNYKLDQPDDVYIYGVDIGKIIGISLDKIFVLVETTIFKNKIWFRASDISKITSWGQVNVK